MSQPGHLHVPPGSTSCVVWMSNDCHGAITQGSFDSDQLLLQETMGFWKSQIRVPAWSKSQIQHILS